MSVAVTTVASCTIRDADADEAEFYDLVVQQAGLPLPHRAGPARVRVALREGQVVGVASVSPDDDGPRLDYVYVHHHARRTGVGRTLVGDACADSTARRRLRIEAHPAAETFFHRLGSCREGTLQPDETNPFARAVFSAG